MPKPSRINRDVWFDRDFTGDWLVGAVGHDGSMGTLAGGGTTGAIRVRSPEVTAFLTLLSRLIAVPAAFHHEPVFTGVEAVPALPGPVVPESEMSLFPGFRSRFQASAGMPAGAFIR